MIRAGLIGLLALSLLGVAGFGAWLTWFSPFGRPLDGPCDLWLDKPEPRWLALKGCTLDVDTLLLESAEGDLETLANRRAGLGSKPYTSPPRWVAAWAPVSSLTYRGRQIRAAIRLEGRDLLAWLNTFEAVDEARREAMWADPVVLRRLATPGVLAGEATRPPGDALLKAWGAKASSTLLTIKPGEKPPPELPAWAIAAAFLGLGLSWVAWRQLGAAQHRSLLEQSAQQLATGVNTRDVKLELGALEELRREEEQARRARRRD